MAVRPKKDFKRVNLKDPIVGLEKRKSYAKDILENAPIFPKPLEYEDIDSEMLKFVTDSIDIVVDGKRVPTYTMYSTYRFSEYNQTWQHTDDDGNLLMNFKTLSREINPSLGKINGDTFNIPGERRYTLNMRTVLDDNGTESYEIYTMKQPMAIELTYKVSFVTSTYELINEFNMQMNNLFKAKQCYIRPNDHYVSMTLESIDDASEYNIDSRKFYTQTANIKAQAYIIRKEDFQMEKKPKRVFLLYEGMIDKPKIDINEYYSEEEGIENQSLDMTINFKAYHDKAEFTMDTDMNVTDIEYDNVRNLRVNINGETYSPDNGFKMHDGDEIRMKIIPIDDGSDSSVTLIGINPNVTYDSSETPESVSDEVDKYDSIDVE